MSNAPRLSDRTALLQKRARMKPDALFLQNEAADDVLDRIAMVKREFTKFAVVTGCPQIWKDRLPDADIVPDEDHLRLEPSQYDVVIHAMSLHWANDLVGQLIQCKRALQPDGLFIATLFGGQTLHELRSVLGQAEIEVTGGLSPRIAPMAEIRDLGALLQRAGLALPVADTFQTQASYRDAVHLMRDLRYMGEGNALVDRIKTPTRKAVIERASVIYQDHFTQEDGRIPATFEIVVLTGWAPSENQPQPLRPGSAQQRLADALGTCEKPLD